VPSLTRDEYNRMMKQLERVVESDRMKRYKKQPEPKPVLISPALAAPVIPVEAPTSPAHKRNKYGAVRTNVDGIWFDSKKEAKRYEELKALERAGGIKNLVWRKQDLTYKFTVNGVDCGSYEADFRYTISSTDAVVVEDVKTSVTKTSVYALKKKLMLAVHGIKIVEHF